MAGRRAKKKTGSDGQIKASWLLLFLGAIALLGIFAYKKMIKENTLNNSHKRLEEPKNILERPDYPEKDRQILEERIKKSRNE